MPKNQAAGADKWRKKIKKYLDDPAAAALSRHSVDSAAIALPLLRAALAGNAPLIAAFPELNLAERAVAELEEFRQELDLPLRLLVIPEAGRGKLLFPGGESRRARALNAALTGEFDLVVGSVHALLAPAPAPETTVEAQLTLKAGMELPMAELLEKLVRLDYDDEYEATVSGEFARRGGIIDIFSPAHDFPCRVEFFGDTIDSLRSFAPETQRSTGAVEEYRVIGRAGITAGGAADSDLFAYFEERDYRLLTLYPSTARERIERYSGEAALARFDALARDREAAGRAQVFCDATELSLYQDAVPADVLPPLGAVLAVLGVLIAISRVVTGVHYISDVLAGLAFGGVFAVLGWNAFVLAASALGFYAIMLL